MDGIDAAISGSGITTDMCSSSWKYDPEAGE